MKRGDTRAKLVDNATQLFATKGFDATSIRELAKATKINVSAISYYFSSKGELYKVILGEQLSPILQGLQLEQKNDFRSSVENLTFFTNKIAYIHKQRPLLSKLIHNEIVNPTNFGGNIIKTYLLQLYQSINSILEEGISQGCFRTDLNLSYATIILSAILNFSFMKSSFTQSCALLEKHANDEYIIQGFHIYLNGIIMPPENETDLSR